MENSSAVSSVKDARTERRKISRSFAFFCFGIFLCWSAFVSLFNLQSSINIENGLGMTTVATSYFVSSTFSIFGVPVMIKRFGPKKCLIIGDAVMLPFILANLYPKYYTMLPAGIIMTLLQSPMWPSMSLLNVLYATWYSTTSKKPKDVHVISFSGYFFTAFQASQVFGNLLSYVVLYGFDQILPHTSENQNNCTAAVNETCQVTPMDYKHCGANDCQNATIIGESMRQYKPTSQISLYILIGIIILLELSATLIHLFFVPSKEIIEKKIEEHDSEKLLNLKEDCTETSLGGEIRDEMSSKNEDAIQAKDNELGQMKAKDAVKEQDEGFFKMAVSTPLAVFKHILQLKLALVLPLTLYNGLAMGFAFTELTRAYASCTLGVQWVGICMACYGITDAVLSWVVGKFGRKVGRIPLCSIAVLLEIGNYVLCLTWEPQPSLPIIVGIFFAFGITDGIFQTFINVTHIDFFPKSPDTTVAVWNILFTLGFSVGYALSTTFCVRTRIYFNISMMCVGAVGFVVADVLHRRTEFKEKVSTPTELSKEPVSSGAA